MVGRKLKKMVPRELEAREQSGKLFRREKRQGSEMDGKARGWDHTEREYRIQISSESRKPQHLRYEERTRCPQNRLRRRILRGQSPEERQEVTFCSISCHGVRVAGARETPDSSSLLRLVSMFHAHPGYLWPLPLKPCPTPHLFTPPIYLFQLLKLSPW